MMVFKNWGLVLVSILLTLFMAELGFRVVIGKSKKPRMAIGNGRTNPWCCVDNQIYFENFHIYRPNIQFKHCYDGAGGGHFEADNCVTYHTNRWGFRDVEIPVNQVKSLYQIVLLGDSFTVGEGVQFEETYSRLLSKALASQKVSGDPVNIVNLAVPGIGTTGQYHLYQTLAKKLSPDLVILQWNTNDFPVSSITAHHEEFIQGHQKLYDNSAVSWSVTLSYFWKQFHAKLLSQDWIALSTQELQQGQINFWQIKAFYEAVQQDHSEFLLLIFPELINFEQYPYEPLLQALEKFCQYHKIPYLNVLSALSQVSAENLWVHETDHHPNHIAHEIVFKQLLESITLKLDSGSIPDLRRQ